MQVGSWEYDGVDVSSLAKPDRLNDATAHAALSPRYIYTSTQTTLTHTQWYHFPTSYHSDEYDFQTWSGQSQQEESPSLTHREEILTSTHWSHKLWYLELRHEFQHLRIASDKSPFSPGPLTPRYYVGTWRVFFSGCGGRWWNGEYSESYEVWVWMYMYYMILKWNKKSYDDHNLLVT